MLTLLHLLTLSLRLRRRFKRTRLKPHRLVTWVSPCSRSDVLFLPVARRCACCFDVVRTMPLRAGGRDRALARKVARGQDKIFCWFLFHYTAGRPAQLCFYVPVWALCDLCPTPTAVYMLMYVTS